VLKSHLMNFIGVGIWFFGLLSWEENLLLPIFYWYVSVFILTLINSFYWWFIVLALISCCRLGRWWSRQDRYWQWIFGSTLGTILFLKVGHSVVAGVYDWTEILSESLLIEVFMYILTSCAIFVLWSRFIVSIISGSQFPLNASYSFGR